MKTRLLIIIGIVVVCSVSGVFGVLIGVDLISTETTLENLKQELKDFCYWSFPKIEHEVYYAECMRGHLVGFNQWVQNQEN